MKKEKKESKKVGRKPFDPDYKRVRVELFIQSRCKDEFVERCLKIRDELENQPVKS